VGVEWGQLMQATFSDDGTQDYTLDTSQSTGISMSQTVQVKGNDAYEIIVQFDPFRIMLRSNGLVLVEINSQDTLFFESGTEAI